MFPIFSSVNRDIYANINSSGKGLSPFGGTALASSELVSFVRLISGTGGGLIMASNNVSIPVVSEIKNPKYDKNGNLINFTNNPSSYGSRYRSGMLGYDWKQNPVFPFSTPNNGDLVLRPSPLITDLQVTEGKDQISRHAKLVIKCFSLAQAEMIQEYCMEPGHSLLIEYGWNTDRAMAQLIDVVGPGNKILSSDEIAFQAANENLNAGVLHEKRIGSFGDYDSFFGFIVGGDMSSEGDIFVLTVNLRGMPGLPTYLQLHQNINKISETKDKAGKVTERKVNNLPEAPPYSQADIENNSYSLQNQGLRRWKWLYNKLPATRQTFEVQGFINQINNNPNSRVGYWDLINFDYVVSNDIINYTNDDWLDSLKQSVGLQKEFSVGGVPIEKERLVSENRYIRFSKVIDILNSNNGLATYKVGNKEVTVKIENNGHIGAFPGIFSTKASKLLIPGVIPNFQEYYLNVNSVNANNVINSPYIDNSINISYQVSKGPLAIASFNQTNAPWNNITPPSFLTGNSTATNVASIVTDKISFVQYSTDKKGLRPAFIDPKDPQKGTYMGYTEVDGYYGELGNLYINFNVFFEALKNSSNKSIREVLMDMLNEMSSAVNSFWNFQLAEQTDKDGNIILKIIDENWAGQNTATIRNFFHAGEKSVFLEANLSIDIPSEMTNQIILKRQDYISNPDSKTIDVGGIFSKSSDKFFKGVEFVKNKGVQQNTAGNTNKGSTPTINQQVQGLKAQVAAEMAKCKPKPQNLGFWNKLFVSYGQSMGGKYEMYVNPAGEDVYTKFTPSAQQAIAVAANPDLFKEITPADTPAGRAFGKLLDDLQQAEATADDQNKTTITANLSKIDVVPNPEKFNIIPNSLEISVSGISAFNDNFKIYCCDDTQLFDIIKNNAFEDYGLKQLKATSHPLPIKYSFKILGKSGLRRGDVFNVWGIPKKYRDFGFFQIVEIEQTLSGNTWTTSVTGQFRQQTQPKP
jgi:hypothetical protein